MSEGSDNEMQCMHCPTKVGGITPCTAVDAMKKHMKVAHPSKPLI